MARRSGFPAATLRYYDDIGLLPAASRTAAGYREYNEGSVERLAFIARAKQLGCSLEEIESLMAAWDTDCGGVQTRLRDLVADKIAAALHQTTELIAFTAQLQRAAAQLRASPTAGGCTTDCACAADAVEIACTLTPDDMPGRVQDWQALTALATGRTEVAGGVRLQFGTDAPLADIARLAGEEQSCCSFFSFAVTVDGRGVGLEVRAPEAAAELLGTLFGLADSGETPCTSADSCTMLSSPGTST